MRHPHHDARLFGNSDVLLIDQYYGSTGRMRFNGGIDSIEERPRIIDYIQPPANIDSALRR